MDSRLRRAGMTVRMKIVRPAQMGEISSATMWRDGKIDRSNTIGALFLQSNTWAHSSVWLLCPPKL